MQMYFLITVILTSIVSTTHAVHESFMAEHDAMWEHDTSNSFHRPNRKLNVDDILNIVESDEFEKNKVSFDPKLGQALDELVETFESNSPMNDINGRRYLDQRSSNGTKFVIKNDKVIVDITLKDVNVGIALLKATAGVEVINCYKTQCSAYVPISDLKAVTAASVIKSVKAAVPKTNTVTSEGVYAMEVDIARKLYNKDGTGILIGVMSDSYDCNLGAAQDILTRDLPSNPDSIIVVADLIGDECWYGIDEGRAMMQLIYDVAPGARLAFRTAYRGEADFAAGILELADIGCDIIVDDIYYYSEPFFQDGIIAQAAEEVVAKGVSYFSSCGNSARNAWEDTFRPYVANGYTFHQFGTDSVGQPIISQQITVPNTWYGEVPFIFQWDEPFASAGGKPCTSDLDVYLYHNGSPVSIFGSDLNVGKDANEVFFFLPYLLDFSDDPTLTIDMIIVHRQGPIPKNIQIIAFADNTIFEFASGSPTTHGHANSANVAGVGAAYFAETPAFGVSPPKIEFYSSAGGIPILFDKGGNRLPSPEIRNQPRFVGPDGTLTTFFYYDNRFFGTSASAPHVAAVAALLLQAKGGSKSMLPKDVYSMIEETSIDMDDPYTTEFDVGFDFGTGYGLVNATAVLERALEVDVDTCVPTWNVYNSKTNAMVASLSDGDTLANPPPCGSINLEAVIPTCFGTVSGAGVFLELYKGSTRIRSRTERVSKYFLFGNNGVDVYDGRIRAGTYSIRATVNGIVSPSTTFTLGGTC